MTLRSTPRLFTALKPLLVCFGAAVAAMTVQAQRMEIAEKELEPVVVESAQITSEVTGRIAVTTFDLVFRNPNSRLLEGSFVLPLLEGQRVTRFALDVNGQLREAVPIEKNRGRVVFEETERRSVDPGLIEQSAGNVYRARVYPIPARGTRHVVIAYQEDLTPSADKSTYRLNLDFPRALKRFRLSLNVHTGASLPAQARTTLDLQLPPWRDAQYMEMERADFDARGVFEIDLPKFDHPKTITGRFRGKEYFYTEVPSTPLLFSRPTPKVVGLLWDSSASGRDRDHDREFALLNAWFGDLKNVEVHLVRLRDRASRDGVFTVQNGDWHALQKELQSTVYDGATSLDGLADDPKVEAWILFSDGFVNYGASEASPKLPLKGVVHSVLSSTRADSRWLHAVAASRGGEYVNLLDLDPAKAAFTLEAQSTRILSIDFDPEAVAQVFPDVGAPIQGDSFVVAGILRKKDARIRITVGHNRENAQPVELVALSGDDPSELAARAWAALKIEQLSNEYHANREDIRATSKEFGIVTPDTSLIVLESVNDYVRYNIVPPDDLRAEWEARRPSVSAIAKGRDPHLESVVRVFNARQAWWEKKFPQDTPKPGASSQKGQAPAPNDEVIVLSPFAVSSARARGTSAPNTFGSSGAELRTSLKAEAEVGSDGADDGGGATITLQKWSPESGYMEHLRRAKADRRYATYLEERPDHQREPGFFLDAADFFFDNQDVETGLRVLSNLAELELDDPTLLRVLGGRLMQANRADLAVPILERVLVLRPEEPQSRRDLALAYAAAGKYQRAVDLLWEIVSTTWDARFPEIELIALEELNAIVATCGQKLNLSAIDPRLLKNMPLDIRAVLTWDANDCDIDLWVIDPNGETAKYDYPLTYQGGRMSRDFTGGYGPEEFLLHRAKPGKYAVRLNYYGDRRQSAIGPVTAQVRVITGFGTPSQQEKRITVRLNQKQEVLDIGALDLAGAKKSSR